MATPPPQTPGRTSQTGRLAQPLQLPALTSKDITGLQIFLAAFSTFRAADYLFSTQHTTTYAELAFPLWAWALACLTVAWCLPLPPRRPPHDAGFPAPAVAADHVTGGGA